MNILLVEPSYKNKYPPLGLMKISQYHKSRGDYVLFCKGKFGLSRIWDRIYITTLFTFDYKTVIDTINFYKNYVPSSDDIYVGGIMASLLRDELKSETNLKNIIYGRLTSSSMISFEDDVNIDQLPLDYDILTDIDYQYPSGDNFFAYTTRGCINKCEFCAVPSLEGGLVVTNSIKSQINAAREIYGDKRNLLLLDNNILGLSERELSLIVSDLNNLGFVNKPNFIKPLKTDILIQAYNRHVMQGRSPIKIMTELSALLKNLQNKRISKKKEHS
ncbi:MAG: hypothetical protein M1486_01870, partial [Gammaproteobacteria bacterium]|nr:hypothetical protein [Gammaproteobacteria bacterium]